jgi:hypothetical protein
MAYEPDMAVTFRHGFDSNCHQLSCDFADNLVLKLGWPKISSLPME